MKKTQILFILLSLASLSVFSQKNILLEEIWTGAYRTQNMEELSSMKKTNQYTVLNYNRQNNTFQIDLFDFATLSKVKSIIDTQFFPNLSSIDSYTFNQEENKILIATNTDQIFRHSFLANYYLFDIKTQELTKITDNKIQEPTFSPDGTKIAFAKENNLFIYNIATQKVNPITFDGKKNAIINGITDWVYEEEFSFVKAFEWNTTGTKIAYIRFDESEVPEFTMDVYGMALYPTVETFKYPKAGENNSIVTLHIFDIETQKTQQVKLDENTNYYIPRLKWTNDANIVSIQTLNRLQNNLNLIFVNATTGATTIVLHEKDKAYIDITDNLTYLKDNSFIWTSEKDGFNHLYWYDKSGRLKNQITNGNWDVTNFYGLNESKNVLYYQSVENGSINRDIYRIALNGKNKTKLSKQVGTNAATFSPNFQYYINSFSSTKNAPSYTLNNSEAGNVIKTILTNEALETKLKDYNLPTKEFFEITNATGEKLNAWIIKPTNFDSTKKYPVFMYQYSGPGSQQVNNEWNSPDDYWFMLLAQQGYIIACVDGRGTGFKGAAFKKCTYKELGKLEVEDQIFAAKIIGNYPYVDKTRIGIFGWSYGGFMSANCILQGNTVFKTAISVAPVTNWRFYDSIYTERYMQTPQENPSGYDMNSPINYVTKLNGNFLLIHGTADDNVHVQNSMRMIESLVQANKQFDWAIYPDKNHGIYGGKTRLQLYIKMTNFIKEKL